jgi:hypothetical protein
MNLFETSVFLSWRESRTDERYQGQDKLPIYLGAFRQKTMILNIQASAGKYGITPKEFESDFLEPREGSFISLNFLLGDRSKVMPATTEEDEGI